MILGVTEAEQKIITNILEEYCSKYSFYYFGSRVKGKYSAVSDLDILIKGKNRIPSIELEEIKEKFDESSLPYIVNFVDYYNISKQFYDSIKEECKNI